ncbi:hypothetical protein C3L33_13954, partial [Rhododendron williamsianum]
MTNHPIGIPACFSSSERPDDDSAAIIRGGQNIVMSAYQTKIAGRFRLITVTWYKNMLVHGLSVSVQGAHGGEYYCRKIQLKPWLFWRKEGLEQFNVDGETIGVVWDLKAAKFNGETGPQSNYYVAIICDQEVVLLLGDLKKDAFRRTGCRPALDDPMLVSRKEHVFGKRKFSTRAKFHEKEAFHEISIECFGGFDPDMEIRIDGDLVVRVKHLQWKFRGNELIQVDDKVRMEVCWDVHDWLFSPGLRHALFIFRPLSPLSLPFLSTLLSPTQAENMESGDDYGADEPSGSDVLEGNAVNGETIIHQTESLK